MQLFYFMADDTELCKHLGFKVGNLLLVSVVCGLPVLILDLTLCMCSIDGFTIQ